MYYAPKHSLARQRHPRRNCIAGAAIAASATFATGVSLSPPAQAAGTVWDVVAACESGGNWAIQSGNGYYGGLQFSRATWGLFGGTGYAWRPDKATKAAQIMIARRTLAAQGPGAWPVCGRSAGLTIANGGAIGPITVSRSRARAPLAARGRLVVDGKMGPRTVRALQRWTGTSPTGVFRARTIIALQRKVGIRPNGALSARTIRALQVRVNAPRDSGRSLNVATVSGLQRYFNRH